MQLSWESSMTREVSSYPNNVVHYIYNGIHCDI